MVEPDLIFIRAGHYLENGIHELWILDADEHTAEVWQPGDKALAVVRDEA